MKLTSWTKHSITPIILLDADITAWTVRSICIQRCPELKLNLARHLAFAYVPRISTFKTNFLATRAHWFIAAACFLDHLFTVRFGTPFFTLVFTYLNVLLDCFVLVLYVFWTKHLDLFDSEFFFTELFRASYFDNLTDWNLNFEMIAHTIHAESMLTFETKEFAVIVVFVTHWTHWSFFCWAGLGSW